MLAIALGSNARAEDAVLARASELVHSGAYAEALALLEPLEPERAGEAHFDALLGAVLLETGDAHRASLVLERAVVLAPHAAGARLDLAIAYYRMRALADAERELAALAALDAPPGARAEIEHYLSLVRSATAGQAAARLLFLSLGSGYDTNANSATGLQQFLGFDLTETSRETSSSFLDVGAGGHLSRPLGTAVALDADARAGHRYNPDASFVDATNLDLGLALRLRGPAGIRSLGVRAYRLHVDGELNSEMLSLAGRWERELRPGLGAGVVGRFSAVRYGDTLEIRDVRQTLLGSGVLWTFDDAGRGRLAGNLVLGTEDAASGSPYDRRLLGLSAGLDWAFATRLRAYWRVSLLESDYEAVFFQGDLDQPRRDTLLQANLGADWRLASDWWLSPSLAYQQNDTNVELFAYDRFEWRVGVRRTWK